MYKIDITNKKFNYLTVIGFSHMNKNSVWDCVCVCGKNIKLTNKQLRSGYHDSCGCMKVKYRGKNTYNTWAKMVNRCTNVNNKNYKDYGGRGIEVCEKWLTFKNFYKDMGDRPKNLTLDRINNNGNYCKENCRWATKKEQSSNTRRNVYITYNGKTQTIKQWSMELNINNSTLVYRIKANWEIEDVFNIPVNLNNSKLRKQSKAG